MPGLPLSGAAIRLFPADLCVGIAEGIETEEQRVLIRRLGCDMIQGYLLSRPLPLEEIIVWLSARRETETETP